MTNNRLVLIFASCAFFIIFLILNNNNGTPTTSVETARPSSSSATTVDEEAPAEVLPPPKTKNIEEDAENNNHQQNVANKVKSSPSQRQFFLPPMANKTLAKLLSQQQSTSEDENNFRQGLCSVSRYSGPNCKSWFKKIASKYFRIHHLHEHAFSIERKVVRLFGPSLAQLFCSSILDQLSSPSKKSSAKQQHLFKGLIIDVGVNDAEDIPYWFEKFGYFDESSFFGAAANVGVCQKLFSEHCFLSNSEEERNSCTKNSIHMDFRLFEPQKMYKKQILQVLSQELARKPDPAVASSLFMSQNNNLLHRHPLTDFVTIHGAFDAVAVGSDELHGTTALFYGQGEQASLGAAGKHAQKSTPVEVPVGSLSKMLDTKNFRKLNQSALEGDGAGNSVESREKITTSDNDDDDDSSSSSPILFMKVDCEGADPTIIVDSEILFSSHRVHLLVFELHKNERGFPKKFVHSTEMLTKHGYEVYLLGRCHHQLGKTTTSGGKGSLMLLKMDTKAASQWSPVLEAGIAISPQLQKILKKSSSNSISEFLGGTKFFPTAGKCGLGWEFVADF